MSDGKIIYEARVDDSKIDSDLEQLNSKTKAKSGKLAGTVSKTAKAGAVALGGAFIAATGAAVKFGGEFEQSLANASTLFGNVDVDRKKLTDGMLELSNKTGIASKELGDTLYNALSAGIPASEDMSESLEFLEANAKLAKAGFTDINTATEATAKVLNAYGMSVEETDKVHKILMQTQNNGITTIGEMGSVLANVTPTASAMGVSFEQVGASLATMTAQGTATGQATTQLNQLIAELGKDGTKASKALEEATKGTKYAGKSFKDVMKEGVPLNEVLDLMGESAKANGLNLIDMFGSLEAGKAALAMSGENAQSFSDNLVAMGEEADVVGEAFEKVTDTNGEKFNQMLNQLKNISIELFGALAPVIADLMPILSQTIGDLAPILASISTMILPVVAKLLEALMPSLSKFL